MLAVALAAVAACGSAPTEPTARPRPSADVTQAPADSTAVPSDTTRTSSGGGWVDPNI